VVACSGLCLESTKLSTGQTLVLYFSVPATASSVYEGDVCNYGPHYAIDGLVSDGTDGNTKIPLRT
jgi:hypothetical protein